MFIKSKNKTIQISLATICLISFFIGFVFNENSAGGGAIDSISVYNNIQIYLNNDFHESLRHENFFSSRTPLFYIMQEFINPFANNEENYKASITFFSLLLPIFFYVCLKKKYHFENKYNLLFIASLILLSPFVRTSAYWGLEENFGLIFLLISVIFFLNFKKEHEEKNEKFLNLFFLITFSSATIYLDQKYLIIPIIYYSYLMLMKTSFVIKLFSTILYSLYALPFIYLLILWKGPFASKAGQVWNIGENFFPEHIGFSITIMAFYLFPLIFLIKKSFKDYLKDFFNNKNNYFFLAIFCIYLIYFFIPFEFDEKILGKGWFYKFSIFIFSDLFYRKIFTIFGFLASWVIILLFVQQKKWNLLIIIYFIILSFLSYSILQEYFDPVILILALLFLMDEMKINVSRILFLFSYFAFFLISSNIYYMYFNLYGN